MAIDVRRRPGRYAGERTAAVVRSRRRQVPRDRSVWLAVGLALSMLVFAVVGGGSTAWFATGVVVGVLAMVGAVLLTSGLGPEKTWVAGAEGERATAVALGPLEAAD